MVQDVEGEEEGGAEGRCETVVRWGGEGEEVDFWAGFGAGHCRFAGGGVGRWG